jgi:ATP-binding cassette, subfamily C, bacterial CydCD
MSRGPVDPRLLRHARSSRTGAGILSLLGAGQAAATVTVAIALTGIVASGHSPLNGALVLLGAAFAARAALTWAEQVVAQRTAAAVTDELRRSTLAAALRHGPAWVARYGSGRLTAVLSSGLDALRPWFSGYLPALVLGVLLPPLVIVAMAVVDPASALIALVTLPLIPVLGALIGWATQKKAKQAWQADARLAGHFLDVVQGLTTLRVYGRAQRQTQVIRTMTDRHRTATVRVLRVAFLSSTALDLVGTLSVGLIAVEVGLRVASGSMPLAPALLVILLAPEAYRPLREMAARYHASADASAVIADVDEVLAPASAVTPPVTSPSAVSPPARSQAGGVHVAAGFSPQEGVLVPSLAVFAGDGAGRFGAGGVRPAVFASRLRVRHPGAAVDALRLDGLAVREGEVVALRGPSGAGKTTTLRVLAGLQPADAGRIELSGPGLLYLPQRPMLPHVRTVADVFPGQGAQEISAALASVGLDGEVTAETVLGEHGAGVSAGQRQRLALAALLRAAGRKPAVLLLDEPTAHLDAEAEGLVIARIRAAAEEGCAVLVVAHRPGLLAAADRIIDITPPTASPLPGQADPSPERDVADQHSTDPVQQAHPDLPPASPDRTGRSSRRTLTFPRHPPTGRDRACVRVR